jgi:hypothetical protein
MIYAFVCQYVSFVKVFSTEILYDFLYFLTRVTYLTHLVLHDMIIRNNIW